RFFSFPCRNVSPSSRRSVSGFEHFARRGIPAAETKSRKWQSRFRQHDWQVFQNDPAYLRKGCSIFENGKIRELETLPLNHHFCPEGFSLSPRRKLKLRAWRLPLEENGKLHRVI